MKAVLFYLWNVEDSENKRTEKNKNAHTMSQNPRKRNN
jgi:hypothetical protein